MKIDRALELLQDLIDEIGSDYVTGTAYTVVAGDNYADDDGFFHAEPIITFEVTTCYGKRVLTIVPNDRTPDEIGFLVGEDTVFDATSEQFWILMWHAAEVALSSISTGRA